jgi:hypothetical protein
LRLDGEQLRAWRGVVKLYMKLPATLDSELQRTAGTNSSLSPQVPGLLFEPGLIGPSLAAG